MRPASLFLPILLFSPTLAAQQPPQRDPQAVAILTQCLNAAGGAQTIAAIQDFTASGTITYFWAGEQIQGSATVRGRGVGQFRLDANLPNGVRSWVASNGVGSLKELNGTVSSIPYHNAVNLGSLTLPYPLVRAATQDASVSLFYLGLIATNGREAHHIRVRTNLPVGADPGGMISKLSKKDFFIDVNTLQLLKTLDMVHPLKRSTEDYPHEIQFSDYRLANGVLIPFLITETIVGQRTWIIQLNQISFNTGLSDSDFRL